MKKAATAILMIVMATYAELYARVGPHLLTVQLNIPTGKTFETSKPSLIALAKAFAAKLR